MPRTCVLAIDQGTTNTKAILMDASGEVVSLASRPIGVTYPRPGWVEQDADALWLATTEAIDACLAGGGGATIAVAGIANQRESVIVWNRRTGRPVGPCVVWQCRRSAPFCDTLRARGLAPLLRAKTGLAIDPLFSASKARWLLDHARNGQARAADGELAIGTVDSWLLWKLTGGAVHACDASNAARTQLVDLRTADWDDGLLKVFDIPRAALPRIGPSSGVFGYSVPVGALPAGVPIASLIGDSHAALFGHGVFEPGAIKATFGTGSSLMTLLDVVSLSHAGLSTTIAWAIPGRTQYAFEGNITATGGAVEWVGQLLDLDPPATAAACLAATVADSGGVYVVPAFAGLGAPFWDADARGLICGLSRGTTSAHIARAAIEAIAYQVRDVFDVMQAEAAARPELLADGGAADNDDLMQFQADMLGRPVRRNRSLHLSACGAAWLAGLAVGVWASLNDLRALPTTVDLFEPRLGADQRDRLYEGWRDAIGRTRGQPREAADWRSAVPSSGHGAN